MIESIADGEKDHQEILDRCIRHDRNAFRELVEQHQDYVYALAMRMLHEEDDAKDIVQESFIRVWNNIHRFQLDRKFTTWLYTIATNLCHDFLRSRVRRNRMITSSSDRLSFLALHSKDDPEQSYAAKEIDQMISVAANELPIKQRTVFILRDLQNLSVHEVSEILSISESAVKTNLVYARRKLKELIQPFFSDE